MLRLLIFIIIIFPVNFQINVIKYMIPQAHERKKWFKNWFIKRDLIRITKDNESNELCQLEYVSFISRSLKKVLISIFLYFAWEHFGQTYSSFINILKFVAKM